MGGNAFKYKGITSERMSLDVYNIILHEVISLFDSLGVEYLTIDYIKEKVDFGDIDILVVEDDNPKSVLNKIIDNLPSNVNHYYRNGAVLSLLWNDLYQIDIIKTNVKYKDYHKWYLSHNDLGNLIGRLVKLKGYKHGHDGLFYTYRNGNHFKKDILLTTDISVTLSILGLDVDQFYSGFNTYTEMFDYVYNCSYFDHEKFKLENLNNKNRVRDRKRKVYNQFLNYISGLPIKPKDDIISPFVKFDFLQSKVDVLSCQSSLDNLYKEKFNGGLVMRITELSGQELGEFIKNFKSLYSKEYIINLTDDQIHDLIVNLCK